MSDELDNILTGNAIASPNKQQVLPQLPTLHNRVATTGFTARCKETNPLKRVTVNNKGEKSHG